MSVSAIGKCVGCGDHGRLDNDICELCYKHRDPKFLELARKLRENPDFALACYNKCKEDKYKISFIQRYGLPPGAVEPRIELESEKRTKKPGVVVQFRRPTK